MRLIPEVVVLDEETLTRYSGLLDLTTSVIEDFAERTPEFAEQMARNGWTARCLALGRIIAGALEATHEDATS